MRRRLLAAACALLAVSACHCGPQSPASHKPATQTGTKLSPLPDMPTIQVQQEALPGANGEVAVVAARPQGELYGDAHPTITFSQPMVAIGSVEEQKSLPPPGHIEPALQGEWRWLGSASVEFVPKGLVPYSTQFTVTIPAGLTAVSGRKLEKDYVFQFSTPRPILQHHTPEHPYDSQGNEKSFNWLKPDQTFTLLFNQPVADLASHVKLLVNGGDWGLKVTKEVDVAEETRKQEEAELAKKGETRHFARQGFEERGFKNEQTRYELVPAKPLPLDTPVTLSIDESLQGKEGPLQLGKAQTLEYRTYGPMKVSEMKACAGEFLRCSYGPVVVFTSNELDKDSLKGKVSITPPVNIDWDHVETSMPAEWAGGETPFFSLPGNYKPGVEYEVSIAAGAKDVFGQAMPAASDTIQTSDLEPYVQLGSNRALLELSGDGALPVESANMDSVPEFFVKLTPPQMAQALDDDRVLDIHDIPGTQPVRSQFSLSGKKNVVHTKPLLVKEALGGPGLFAVQVQTPGFRNDEVVIGQLTDLAVHSKLGSTSGLIWVTRLSDGSSVAGAAVTLWSGQGESLWTGTTDSDGLVRTPGLSKFTTAQEEESATYRTPFVLCSAEKDGDTGVTASSWTDSYSAGSDGMPEDWDGKTPKSRSMVFAERGIYRPGNTVLIKGLVRYRRLGELAAPPKGSDVTVDVTTGRGKQIGKTTAKLSEFGTYDWKVEIPADAPLGAYAIHATATVDGQEVSAGNWFRVEEYRPPQFKVDVTSPKKDFIAGEDLEATVLARYLFGGTMSGADTTWSVNRTTTHFTPPGNADFSFGNEVWGWGDGEAQSSSDVFASGTGKTDAMGVLTVKPGKAETPTGRTCAYTIEAEVADVSRQRIADRVELTVHPAASYAGLRSRSSSWFAEAGKASVFELIAVDPAGTRQVGVKLDLKVQRREWKSIRKKGVGDRWTYEEEKVDTDVSSCSVKSEQTPQTCSFTPTEPGLYVLSATATDSAGRQSVTSTELWVAGTGWVSWQRNEGDKLDLVADKHTYDVGDTAKILVKSPFPEADAVLTVEREGVMTAKRVHLKGAATALEVPIDESLVPNAFVGVVLVRGRVPTRDGLENGDDPGRPAVRVGYVQLDVEKKSKRLAVTITPDAAVKRPREKVRVDLAVADWKGRGTPAEVTLWAVDEGVLRLTGYKTPDPVETVHPKLWLSVRIGEPLLNLVARRKYGDKGASAGGSGGDDSTGADVRRAFKTTAAFEPHVVTDASGKAHVEFELPDNLTTFRLMAVAVTKDDRFGSAESSVTVSKPLLALPALPRFARVGDSFEAGVVVHSPGGKVKDVTVSAKTEGLSLDGPVQQSVALAEGRPQEVRFHFQAARPGNAKLTFRVEGGGESDAVEQVIPIELPVGMEAVAVFGDTKDTKREGLVPPSGVRSDVGGLDLTMASTIMGGFSENMRQLVEYPYGCLEQLTSRLIPFVELRKLHSKFDVAWEGATQDERDATKREDAFIHSWLGGDTLAIYDTNDPDVVIRKTLAAIEKLQNHDGGFKYWEDSQCSNQWTSAYAVLVLKRAKDVGYPVDEDVISRGQDYLADTVAAGRCTSCWGDCIAPNDATRVNALYALARTGKPKASYYPELFARREKLPLFAQAMLDDAIFAGGGDRAQGKELFQEILNHAKETPKGVHFEETDPLTYASVWSSDTRTTAIVLQTLTDIAPDHPYVSKIGNYLTGVRKGDGQFRNTQEAAFALMALSEVVATKEKDVPDFTAKVTLGQDAIASATFKGRSMDAQTAHVDIAKVATAGTGQLPFDFTRTGAGVLYYGALLRYAPSVMPMDALDRGMVVQRWFEPWQGGGQITTAHAGDLVRIRLRVGTAQARDWVAVEVPLPAGLEAIDTTLATTAHNATAPHQEADDSEKTESDEDTYADGRDDEGSFSEYASTFWSPFNHTEERDDRVVLFADHLPPGVHVASFVARATTPGEFLMKPAHAEEMYDPEVFGRSTGGTFKVLLGTEVASGN